MKPKLKSIFLAVITICIAYLLLIFPEQSFHASIRGLHIWWEVVFPSLLPFFITAELLISFGVVQFIGVIFQPIMRPLFNVPGIGSFAWILGMASGYPAGAKITTRLRQEQALSQIEAERLVSFSNASSPLFIFGAISIGFFHNAKLGIFIAFSHYVGNILVGICMRFYGKNKLNKSTKNNSKQNIIKHALQKMHQTRIVETRPFGEIVGDAVVSSVQTLMMIGGFIILFSVFTTMLNTIQVTAFIQWLISPLLLLLNIPINITTPFITGLFEITMGIEMISKLKEIPLLLQLTVVSFVLGFNGFSVQAQVASIIAKTDIRFYPYFFARILHGIFASILTLACYTLFFPNNLQPTFNQTITESYPVVFNFFTIFGPMITLLFIFLTICILYRRLVGRNI